MSLKVAQLKKRLNDLEYIQPTLFHYLPTRIKVQELI